ncbi:MAG: hypothetical protein Q7R57_05650 [Dehalococcoidales bacterium]|nr:hypothetical protein [Dehalococcoidales bacterium]
MYRSLFSDCAITEEADRYVITQSCGTGGRLRQAKKVAVTAKAHPWSWGRSGVSLYCTHCCIMWEILPIELRGYPVKLCLYRDNPEEPCVQLVYKRPELIPEDYYRKLGVPVWKKK